MGEEEEDVEVDDEEGDDDICVKCNEPLAGKGGCTAMGKTFHLNCFCCQACGAKLAGAIFYAVEGNPHCDNCYENTLDKCTRCSKPIKDRILKAGGKPYHPKCFACIVCNKTLDGVPFTMDDKNAIHCVPCFNDKFAPRCHGCKQPIVSVDGDEDSYRIIILEKDYHMGCYKCEDCAIKLSSKIEGRGCYPLDGSLLCKACNIARVVKAKEGK